MTLLDIRNQYHKKVAQDIIRIQKGNDPPKTYPNFADTSSKASVAIAWDIVHQIGYVEDTRNIQGQVAGDRFEEATKEFLEESFSLLSHLRPGKWIYSTKKSISDFSQYKHLAALEIIIGNNPELSSALGLDYIVKPDIVIGRYPVSENDINSLKKIISSNEEIASLTPFRMKNLSEEIWILHGSVSCKWTLRSDRSQNARTEALNLIRNRKGNLPHVVAVTAEPLPTRIASLALGTGDLDCVYHFALNELQKAIDDVHNEDQKEVLSTLIDGGRLRDISDLPFDLAV